VRQQFKTWRLKVMPEAESDADGTTPLSLERYIFIIGKAGVGLTKEKV